jgi:hypothetical protein
MCQKNQRIQGQKFDTIGAIIYSKIGQTEVFWA